MDTKKYEALITAIHSGSFTKAALELGYTQSGMTHMMSKLESEIGFSLFKRGHYGVELTKEGRAILPEILNLLASKDSLQNKIDQIKNETAKSINIGCYTSISMQWLPLIIQRFREDFPDVNLEINVGGVDEIYNWLIEGKVDMIFASREYADKIQWITLRHDPLLAILPNTKDNENLETFPIENFTGTDFLMPYMGFDKDITRVFNKRGAKPNIKATRIDDPAIIAMVEHGWGVSILSELIMSGRNDNIKSVPLSPACSRELGIALNKNSEPNQLVRKFIEYSKSTVLGYYKDKSNSTGGQ